MLPPRDNTPRPEIALLGPGEKDRSLLRVVDFSTTYNAQERDTSDFGRKALCGSGLGEFRAGGKSDLHGRGGVNPNAAGDVTGELNGVTADTKEERIVDGNHLQAHTGANSGAVEEFQELAVALEYAGHGKAFFGEGLVERLPAVPAAGPWGIQADDVAVGASAVASKLFGEFAFEIGGNGVLEVFGFVMDLVPLESEDFGEHTLDEMMAVEDAVGDGASGGREGDLAASGLADELIALEAADGHGNRRSGDFEPAGESYGLDDFAFGFGFGDGFEVILLRDGDAHARALRAGR